MKKGFLKLNAKKIVFAFIVFCLMNLNVMAEEEAYYINDNGISFTEREYDVFSRLADQNYVKIMTQQDYDNLSKLDPNNREVKIDSFIDYGDYISTRATSIATSYKRLTIGGSCMGGICDVSLTSSWLKSPNVRSWDLMGARFLGTSLTSNDITTTLTTTSGITVFNNYKITSGGFGNSIKLPTGNTTMYALECFTVKPGGTVFGSYQHATKSISLGTSRNYNISMSGYGSVFLPYGTLVDVLDEMAGVYIYLS